MRADLDTLLIALYCAACALFPADSVPKRGRPELITDNELLCLMVAKMLLQCPSDRIFLGRARRRLGHLFPYLPSQSRYNERRRLLVPKLAALWKALTSETLGSGDDLRLLDTTPLPCGQSIQTTRTSELAPWAGFGYCPAHSRRYWGFKLVLLSAPDGAIIDFDLVAANAPERTAALALLESNPIEGVTIICDKGFAGSDFEAAVRELEPCSFAQVVPMSPIGPTRRLAGYASGSNRSSQRSRTNFCSNAMAAVPPQAYSPASPPAFLPSAPASTSISGSVSTVAS